MQRLRYQAQLAERQFLQSDPENRLVTGELERRWEASLRELKSAEEERDRHRQDAPSYMIPADLLETLRDVGPRLPELWNAKLLRGAQKTALLRSLIDKVVIHRLAPDQVQTRVVWRGGATTGAVVRVTVGKFAWLSGAAEMEETIKRMTKDGHRDAEIAEHLTAHGHRSPRADKVLESTVRLARLRLGLLRTAHQSHPRHVQGFLTIPQLAKKLGVSPVFRTLEVAPGDRGELILPARAPAAAGSVRRLITAEIQIDGRLVKHWLLSASGMSLGIAGAA